MLRKHDCTEGQVRGRRRWVKAASNRRTPRGFVVTVLFF
jgi:hypothetical protein